MKLSIPSIRARAQKATSGLIHASDVRGLLGDVLSLCANVEQLEKALEKAQRLRCDYSCSKCEENE